MNSATRGRGGQMKIAVNIFAVLGFAFIALVVAGFVADFRAFDRTSGGYESPYEGWTGTPIDWNAGDMNADGFVRRGRVLNTLLNCTNGIISFQVYGMQINFRKISERAIKVHKPREACIASGFAPEF